MRKRIFLTFIIFSLFITFNIWSQDYKIDYYGIVCNSIDSNMAKMTSDLYYTQLCEISSFEVTDKRVTPSMETEPDTKQFSDSHLSFYTKISKNEDETSWCATIVVYDKFSMTNHSKSKNYDSFYKILVESKQNLQDSIKSLIENYKSNEDSGDNTQEDKLKELSFSTPKTVVSTEALSGNWTGEEYIDKIMIMRGGRGFIIFKNGATMNISISIDNSTVIIKQSGKANASFFPELSRNIALNAALSAEPIIWTFTSEDSDTLKGTKKTLIPDNDSYKSGIVNVTWKRMN